jgi:hypothetical protein
MCKTTRLPHNILVGSSIGERTEARGLDLVRASIGQPMKDEHSIMSLHKPTLARIDVQYDCDTKFIHSSAAGSGGISANQKLATIGEEAASPIAPILAISLCPPKFQAQQTNAF